MKNNDLYLIASYTAKPRNPKMTKVAGYMKDSANIVYDEKVEFSIGTKNKDINAGVMLNLTKRQVVKNKFQPDADFETVVKYYCDAYPEYMAKAGFTLEKEPTDESDVQPVQAEEEKGD
jgi:hypothetical protein